jgi:hypothetical protein
VMSSVEWSGIKTNFLSKRSIFPCVCYPHTRACARPASFRATICAFSFLETLMCLARAIGGPVALTIQLTASADKIFSIDGVAVGVFQLQQPSVTLSAGSGVRYPAASSEDRFFPAKKTIHRSLFTMPYAQAQEAQLNSTPRFYQKLCCICAALVLLRIYRYRPSLQHIAANCCGVVNRRILGYVPSSVT